MSLTAYVGAAIHDGTRLHHGSALLCESDVVAAIAEPNDLPERCIIHKLDGGFLTPGFVDLQVNGGGGVMFNDDQSVAALRTIANAHAATGTRALLPTLITDTPARSRSAIAAVAAAIDQDVAGIVGIHLEGPHLSLKRKGAHDPWLIRAMSQDDETMLIEAAAQLPNVLLTIAPESVTLDQVARLSQAGVIISLGHSDAGYDTAMAYMAAGARCTTHLFNAMSQLGNREPGLVGATLDNANQSAGLIADAVHVHPATIRAALRANQGPGQIFLVTDAMSSVGSDLTEFELNGRTVFRRDGTLRLSDGTLAGADIDMPGSIGILVNQVGLDPEYVISMATSLPRKMLRPAAEPDLLVGQDWGNAVYLDKSFTVQRIG